AEVPPRALIQTIETTHLPPAGYTRFEIRHSDRSGARTVLVLPDIATCADCRAELFDPTNRRYRYPFTNCTNCGPRFTIIEALPYDRPNTTMRRFALCPACQAEYEDPLDRRFHAQPNACPVCGPRLTFYEHNKPKAGDGTERPEAVADAEEALQRAADALRAGRIVAVKGLGGFHLMVDARNDAAIQRLRESKPRRAKPFALMARDLAQVRQFCEVPPAAEALLTSVEAPIVLLRKLAPHDGISSSCPPITVSPLVAPANPYLGVMLPYTPLHHLLLRELDFPVIATSGNLADEPICTDETEAMQRLGHIADAFLVHDRPIVRHADDSVAWIVAGAPRLLRRARGYAPLPVLLKEPAATILAVGAHLKNTVALSVGRQVFISQHIGDLETPEAMAAFERVIADFLRLYEAAPVAIAHDMHPDYLSTRWAQEDRGLPGVERRIAVQHHHAHLAACLAENQVAGPALGVTWDGTGYGPDGTIWGGEFLLGDATGYERVAHLRPFRLPGGEAAVREPRRVALALLWELFGAAALAMDDLAPIRDLRPAERTLLAQMLARGVHAPITTSVGRLFDGIAALIGLPGVISFEGQAAMALEFVADTGETGAYEVALATSNVKYQTSNEVPDDRRMTFDARRPRFILDWAPLVTAVLADLRRGVSQGIMAARFHNCLLYTS
ncbi:MAG: carbamoyltransferase HypF, partial [Anaerolineae bacterium]|nr:carbamoyltransferase HypF [Anaerolineae bacterium]